MNIQDITAKWSDEAFEGPCETCQGSGRMMYGFYAGGSTIEDDCYQCNGTGLYTPDPTCPRCGFPFDPGFRMNLGKICPECCDAYHRQHA